MQQRRVVLALIGSSLLLTAMLIATAITTQYDSRTELFFNPITDVKEHEAFVFHGQGVVKALAIDASNGMFLDGAHFELHSDDGTTILKPVSKNGYIELTVEAPMTYTVTVTKKGYVQGAVVIDVDRDDVTSVRVMTVPVPSDKTYKGYVVLQWGRYPENLVGVLTTPRCEIDPDSPRHCSDPRVKVLHQDYHMHGPDTIGIKEFEAGDYYYQVYGLDELQPFGDTAKVTVFLQGREPYEYILGRDGFVHAPIWKVFRIFNGGRGRWGAISACPNEACAFGLSPIH